MPVTISGDGIVTGIAVGGLPNGIIDESTLANNAVTPSKSTITPGITHCDQWRLTANIIGDKDPITGDLERVDDASFTKIGSAGMTESSGTWSFPVSGIWKVEWNIALRYNGSSRWNDIRTFFSSNNGGAWDEVVRAVHGLARVDSTNTYTSAHSQCIVDVTDVAQCKVKFGIDTEEGGEQVSTHSGINFTYWTFTRLGDT